MTLAVRRRATLVAVLLLLPALGSPAEKTCDIHAGGRIVAVGDVHGAYDGFVSDLRMAGLVDEKVRWTGGDAVLVQTGDLLDRGVDTRAVLDMMMRLQKEAKKAGGRVVALLGNHEVMNMLGDLRYVNPEEYESFRTSRSVEVREQFWKNVLEGRRKRAEATGETLDERALREQFEKEAPLGFVERTQAFSARGEYGRWLRDKSAVARVDGVVFVHGGLTPEVAALGCEAINERVTREITSGVDETRSDPLASLVASENGPLWYRGLAKDDEAVLDPEVRQVLQDMGARAIVVGHTVTESGGVELRFGGRVVMIDAGMGEIYGGHRAALEIEPDGSMAALSPEGRRALVAPSLEKAPASEPAAAGATAP